MDSLWVAFSTQRGCYKVSHSHIEEIDEVMCPVASGSQDAAGKRTGPVVPTQFSSYIANVVTYFTQCKRKERLWREVRFYTHGFFSR